VAFSRFSEEGFLALLGTLPRPWPLRSYGCFETKEAKSINPLERFSRDLYSYAQQIVYQSIQQTSPCLPLPLCLPPSPSLPPSQPVSISNTLLVAIDQLEQFD
jgi:hypothetical protein